MISGYEGSKARQVLITEADLPRVLESSRRRRAVAALRRGASGPGRSVRLRALHGPAIGETLRETRIRQKLDIADVEEATKIRAKYLRALENEEFGHAARARPSSRPSCAPTRSCSASIRTCSSRSTAPASRTARTLERRSRSAPPGARARTGAGAGRAAARDRCCCWSWWPSSAVLFVLGLTGGRRADGGRRERRPPRRPRAPSPTEQPPAAAGAAGGRRGVCVVRITPDHADLRVRRPRARSTRGDLRGHDRRAADRSAGKVAAREPRQDGGGDRRMNGRRCDRARAPEPIGFEFTAPGATRAARGRAALRVIC